MIHGLQELETPKHFLLTPGADYRGERQVSYEKDILRKEKCYFYVFFLLFVKMRIFFLEK